MGQASPNWHASMTLRLGKAGRITKICGHESSGPLKIQRPFYPEGDLCHLYLLYPPGGLVGGDSLELDVTVDNGASTLITTPAATKFYRSNGLVATQVQKFQVGADASFEWLPQEVLLFGGSKGKSQTKIALHKRSRFVSMELFGLGRPAYGDHYQSGKYDQSLSVLIDGEPLVNERHRWSGRGDTLDGKWGMGKCAVFGALHAGPVDNLDIQAFRQRLQFFDPGVWSVSCINSLFVARYLGNKTEEGLALLRAAWREIRPMVIGRDSVWPRIWNT